MTFEKKEPEKEENNLKSDENKYKYRVHSLSLTHYEEAIVEKAKEIASNHFPERFKPAQLKTPQAFIKAIGMAYCPALIEEWENIKAERANNDGSNNK